MPLPTRKVVGQAVYGDNTGASGRLRFSPEFLVAYDGVVVLPGPVTVIAGNGGHFEVELATTDAEGYAPADWVWSVEELWPGGRLFFFQLPTEDGSPVAYTSLIPAESVADPYAAHTHPELGGLPAGGVAGDLIVKQSSLTGDVDWQAPTDLGIIVEGDARLTDERTPTVHGNEAHTLDFVDAAGAEAAAPVQSVNTLTGDVVLDAGAVGALPDDAELDDLADVEVGTAAANDLLAYDGTDWVPTDSPSVKRVSFNTATPGTLNAAGDVAWDDLDQALSYRTNGITVDIAQENLVYVRNPAGNTAIPKGAGVAVKGAAANRLEVQLCDATAGGQGCRTLGVAITAIPSPGFGFVSTFGVLRGFNTGAVVTSMDAPMVEGAELYITGTPGVLATFPQPSPGRRVLVGYVITTGQNGSIFVTVRRGLTVNELDNVLAPAPTDGQTLTWDNTQGVWVPVTPTPSPVTSVNTQTGAVVLGASDVGALPDDAELDDLADVSVGGANNGDVLAYDGSDWVPDSTAVRSDDVARIVVLTETEYDALDPADPTVLYVVVEDPEEDEE
jgi:hypothetical protein